MKRVYILGIFLFVVQIGILFSGFYFFYRKIPFKVTDKTTRELVINSEDPQNVVIEFVTQSLVTKKFEKDQKINLTEEEYKQFQKDKIVGIPYHSLHAIIWIMLYWAFASVCLLFSFARFLDLFFCDLESYPNSRKNCKICSGNLRCSLYRDLRNVNLEPIKKEWYRFWCYE